MFDAGTLSQVKSNEVDEALVDFAIVFSSVVLLGILAMLGMTSP